MAALHSGNDCLVVTSDHLRQHFVKLYQMDPELGRLFDQWQVLHQVQVTGQLNRRTVDPGRFTLLDRFQDTVITFLKNLKNYF